MSKELRIWASVTHGFTYPQRLGLWLGLILVGTNAGGAADLAVREKLEHEGWVIGFDAPDRPIAEALAPRLEHFAKRIRSVETMTFVLGPEEIEARAGELAAGLARLCALPQREAEIRAEILRFVPPLAELRTAMPRMFLPSALDLWRTEAVIERAQTGVAVPGVKRNTATGRPRRAVRFDWILHVREHRVTWSETPPPAIVLLASVPPRDERAAARFADELEAWIRETAATYPDVMADAARLAMWGAAFNTLDHEVSADPASRWIVAGVAGWTWSELARSVLPPAEYHRHVGVVPRLPVSGRGKERLNLEEWPLGDNADHDAMARQVFCNIADWHGVDAVIELLNAFWELPGESRTSARLKILYRELMREPLEIRAPWQSLGEVESPTGP